MIRTREIAVTRTSFSDAGEEIERSLALQYQAFSTLADVSTLLPIVRDVAAARDQSEFGLGTREADLQQLQGLHASLRDADWDAWDTATRRGAVAVADYKGRLLYVTGNPAAFGDDLRALHAVADAYARGGSGTGAQVLRGDDAELVRTGLAPPSKGPPGLVLLFVRASVMAGVPQAAFLQILDGSRLLADLSVADDARLALVAPDGSAIGDVPPALLGATHDASGLVERRVDGRIWLAQRHDLPGLAPGSTIATLVLARPADAGLAGFFPYARLLLAMSGFLAAALLIACLLAIRRRGLAR